ncbi:VWA domain-containing protein, partial [bacterium]|nr:VWA domain-containing protein [candidate division CSSED10-310 bacterium]
ALVLMTDGESHESDPLEAAGEAARDGVRIFTVGFGSPAGVPIPLRDDTGDTHGYRKDRQGNIVVSKLDEVILEKIALASGGTYYRATTNEDELAKIQQELQDMEKRELESRLYTHKEDKFQLFLLPAIVLLAIEAVVTDRRRAARKGERLHA